MEMFNIGEKGCIHDKRKFFQLSLKTAPYHNKGKCIIIFLCTSHVFLYPVSSYVDPGIFIRSLHIGLSLDHIAPHDDYTHLQNTPTIQIDEIDEHI